MIGAREIQRLAYEHQVPEQMIERDYVLTWVMIGVAKHRSLKQLIAKGGTAIKKLYFANWRYSEDLDLTAAKVIPTDALINEFDAACRFVRETTGIESRVASAEPRGAGEKLRNVTLYLDYVGPLRRTRRPRQLKVDVTFDEVIVNPAIQRPLLKSYSDEPKPATRITVYALEEICAEKMRTMLQRTEPRDLYDVWRILDQRADELDAQRLRETFEIKCRHRHLQVDGKSFLSDAQVEKYHLAWESRLLDQISDLPRLESVIRETRRLLKAWLA